MPEEKKIVELKEEKSEKVFGGFTPTFNYADKPFKYDGCVYRYIFNGNDLMVLEKSKWAVRLDENGDPTEIYVQIPFGTQAVYLS